MLGKNALLASTALVASLALAACTDNDTGGGGAPLDFDPAVDGPLGLMVGEGPDADVDVISADHQPDASVFVTDDRHSVKVLSLDPDGLTFEIEITMPDASVVTLTEADISENSVGDQWGSPQMTHINGQHALRANLDTDGEGAAGDQVNVLIGLGLDAPHSVGDLDAADATEALVMLARIDQAGDDIDGFNAYLMTGEVTETLPTGWAEYNGRTISTVYVDGGLWDETVFGSAWVVADFGDATVDIRLDGSGSYAEGEGGSFSYVLYGDDIPIDGSSYEGALGVANLPWVTSEVEINPTGPDNIYTVDLAGDVIGAFYGEDAEATGGVFGAEETNFEDADVEIVGGYIAYGENLDEAPH